MTRERDKREGQGFAVTAWSYKKNSERVGFSPVHLEIWYQAELSGKQASWRDRPNFAACISISHCRSPGHSLKTQIPKPSLTRNVKYCEYNPHTSLPRSALSLAMYTQMFLSLSIIPCNTRKISLVFKTDVCIRYMACNWCMIIFKKHSILQLTCVFH